MLSFDINKSIKTTKLKIDLCKVIAAEGEQKASRALKEASDVMAQSNVALQLRYLQVGTKYQVSSTKYQMMAQSNVALQLRYLQASAIFVPPYSYQSFIIFL